MPFLPTSVRELKILGWERPDIILFSGDAYVDHPSFGTAVIGRALEAEGYRVAIVPQPNWRDDRRDFKKLGQPRLFFGVTSGGMDSMVNHYTANKRLRSNDAYTPGGKAGFRPDYATTVYTQILRELFPGTPVIIGGIEASLRRLTHYDYWRDRLLPSVLVESKADLLVYGMGEAPVREIARRLANGEPVLQLRNIPQTAYLAASEYPAEGNASDCILHSFEECMKSKRKFAENFAVIEQEANKKEGARRLIEPSGGGKVVVNPPGAMMTEKEIDASFDLPYTRLPHPRYRGKPIPAYEMIKHSVMIHRGCFGGCSFCTIAAHQGRFIVSRSEQSILREVERITQMDGFKGYLSDVGGPSANMYGMKGKEETLCVQCRRHSCIFPRICKNLHTGHSRLLNLYGALRKCKAIKKAFIGSGIRYDLFLDEKGFSDASGEEYFRDLLRHHVSGRLKVAPEHTEQHVLQVMRKPSFALFEKLKELFDTQNRKEALRLQLVPYFISSHPGCTENDMRQLARKLQRLSMHPEQVQDFTPTPMTHASAIFYAGIDPCTMQKVYVPRAKTEKLRQKEWFFRRRE
ncbi:MAG: YgiQ family radical SAM protein [Prevotellaceae bacterium]|nr:YgiQ family radical SAM protein [Prevotellaceae bacterium]